MRARAISGAAATQAVFSVMMVAGLWSIYTVPILIGVLQRDFSLTAGSASVIGSLQLGAAAITSIAMGRFRALQNVRAGLALAAALVVGGCMLATAMRGAGMMCTLMVLVGIGQGIYLADASMLVARQPGSERLYGRVFAIAAIVLAVVNFTMPAGITWFGGSCYFVVSACSGLLVLATTRPLFTVIRRGTVPVDVPAGDLLTVTPGTDVPSGYASLLLLVVGIAMNLPLSGIWAVADPLASIHNLSLQQTGIALSTANAAGFVGGELSRRLGLRLGAFIPNSAVAAGLVLVIVGLGASTSPLGFTASLGSLGVLYVFIASQMMSVAAVLDRTGGLAAQLNGVNSLSGSVGTAAYGLLLARYGTTGIILAGIASMLVVIAAAAKLQSRQVMRYRTT